jgi:hypothetical protein
MDRDSEKQLTLFLLDGLEGELVGVSASRGPWLVSSRLVLWLRLADGGIVTADRKKSSHRGSTDAY